MNRLLLKRLELFLVIDPFFNKGQNEKTIGYFYRTCITCFLHVR